MELLNFEELFELTPQIRELAEDQQVPMTGLAELAREVGKPEAHVVAAMVLVPDLTLRREHPTIIDVCLQGCQMGGAVATLKALVAARAQRVEDGKTSFDVRGRACMDACHSGPTLSSRGPAGAFLHPRMIAEHVDELLAALLDEEHPEEPEPEPNA